MASALDVRIVKNNDIAIQFSVKDKNGVAVNLTDFIIKWQVKKSVKAVAVITKDSQGNGINIISAAGGTFVVRVAAIDTTNLDPGSYFHEAILTDPFDNSVTLTDLGLAVGAFFLREQYAIQD